MFHTKLEKAKCSMLSYKLLKHLQKRSLLLFQEVLVITTDTWSGQSAQYLQVAANLRKQAAVYALGIRPQVQEPQLQQITQNSDNNFLVGSYGDLQGYWRWLWRMIFWRGKPCKF